MMRANARPYSLEYVEDFMAEHDADGHRSFAGVERSLSDRLPARIIHQGSSRTQFVEGLNGETAHCTAYPRLQQKLHDKTGLSIVNTHRH